MGLKKFLFAKVAIGAYAFISRIAQHLTCQFKCKFRPFRLQLLPLTQVLTATTRSSEKSSVSHIVFHHTASSGWDRTCWSISMYSLESLSVSLRHPDSKECNTYKVGKRQKHANQNVVQQGIEREWTFSRRRSTPVEGEAEGERPRQRS